MLLNFIAFCVFELTKTYSSSYITKYVNNVFTKCIDLKKQTFILVIIVLKIICILRILIPSTNY